MMIGVWNRIAIFATIIVSNSLCITAPLCYCTARNKVEAVFQHNAEAKKTSTIHLENTCFIGSIRGNLFCPKNHTFCIKQKDLHSTCDETLHNSKKAYSTVGTTRQPALNTGIRYMSQRRFLVGNSHWGEWGTWEECVAKACGEFGIHRRKRVCVSKSVAAHCDGDDAELESCFKNCTVPVIIHWGEWGNWEECVANACGEFGIHRRKRVCISNTSGEHCDGDDAELEKCLKNCTVPVDGKFSNWSPWSSCPVSCNGGPVTRSRYCNNPKPQYGGKDCIGPYTDIGVCNTQECPVNGGWADWLEWGSRCSVTCGHGVVKRYRQCSNPIPINCGAYCVGELFQSKACVQPPCSIDSVWSSWSAWSHCDVTCARGTQYRNRTCNNPTPGGKDCQGGIGESKICTHNPCPGTI